MAPEPRHFPEAEKAQGPDVEGRQTSLRGPDGELFVVPIEDRVGQGGEEGIGKEAIGPLIDAKKGGTPELGNEEAEESRQEPNREGRDNPSNNGSSTGFHLFFRVSEKA